MVPKRVGAGKVQLCLLAPAPHPACAPGRAHATRCPQMYVPRVISLPGSVRLISQGGIHALAQLSNGTIIGWGNNNFNQTDVPAVAQGRLQVRRLRCFPHSCCHLLAVCAHAKQAGLPHSEKTASASPFS